MRCIRPLAMLVATIFLVGTLWAQDRTQDRIVLKSGKTVSSVQVTVETWKTVQFKDTAGQTLFFRPDQVREVMYGADDQPRYMLDAMLLVTRATGAVREPQKLIRAMDPIYRAADVPDRVRQHGYYYIARAYQQLAQADPKRYTTKTVAAYQKLFHDIPDSVYAVTGRFDLAEFLIEAGKPAEATTYLKAVADGPYGELNAARARLMLSQTLLASSQYAEAEQQLDTLLKDPNVTDARLKFSVRLMLARAKVEQQKYDEAWKLVNAVLAEKPGAGIVGMAYGVLGDYFAAKGDAKTALEAYLKVVMMYRDAGQVELARAYREAIRMCVKLDKPQDADRLRQELRDLVGGAQSRNTTSRHSTHS